MMYLVVFNYSDEVKPFTIDFSRIGLKAVEIFSCENLITQRKESLKNNQTIKLVAKDAVIFKIVFRPTY